MSVYGNHLNNSWYPCTFALLFYPPLKCENLPLTIYCTFIFSPAIRCCFIISLLFSPPFVFIAECVYRYDLILLSSAFIDQHHFASPTTSTNARITVDRIIESELLLSKDYDNKVMNSKPKLL